MNTATELTVADLAAKIMAAQRARRSAAHNRPMNRQTLPATYATSLGYRCERRIVYQRTEPQAQAETSEELCSIFEEGNLHQMDVRSELARLGYEMVEAESGFRDQVLEISGRIDGKLALSSEHGARRIPIEIKSTSGNPPATAEAMRAHGGLYGRYYAQMQVYLFLTSENEGLFLFKDKITGLWSLVPIAFDFEYAETLLRRAERVRDHVRAETVPNRLPDRSECAGCPWRDTLCHPAQEAVDPLLLAEDAELHDQMLRRETLDPLRREYEALDEGIKERFNLTAGERFVVGGASGFLVTKKKHGKGIRIDIRRLADAT